MEAGTIKPNKAMRAIWANLKDPEAARREYETCNDDVRNMLNEWAKLDPQQRDEVRQLLKAKGTGRQQGGGKRLYGPIQRTDRE